MNSVHLKEIIENHNSTCNAQVVFFDAEAYSKRRTRTQIAVINKLTDCLRSALGAVGKQYLTYTQSNNLNFLNDIVTIPTGDGGAVVFTFDGLHDIHLSFALHLLDAAYKARAGEPCAYFAEHGWCNCHPYLNLRIGISEGKAIVFSDVNGNYNVAGSVMNIAARVMGLCDRNQIVFSEDGYREIIEMSTDAAFIQRFREFRDVEIKHGEKINVFQYTEQLGYLNSDEPERLSLGRRARVSLQQMRALGLPMPDPDAFDKVDQKAMVGLMELVAGGLAVSKGLQEIVHLNEPPRPVGAGTSASIEAEAPASSPSAAQMDSLRAEPELS